MFKKTLIVSAMAAVVSATAFAGGILHRGNGGEPATLDPHFATGTWENNIIGEMFMGLTTETASGKMIPGLAESWTVSPDGRIYTFTIRDAKWSDGKPITAHDFEFSLKRILNPETAAGYSFILYPIKNAKPYNSGEANADSLGVKAKDDKTLVIELEDSTPYFLEQLTHYTSWAVPTHVVKKHGKEWTKKENIVVSGAFILDTWNPQTSLTVKKNPYFFDADNVGLDGVAFYPIENANAELKRYRAGEIDTTSGVPGGMYDKLKADFGDNFIVAPRLGTYYYPVNTEIVKDVNVRKAMSLAINRDVIAHKIVGNGEIPAYSFVPPGTNNYVSNADQPKVAGWNKSYAENLAQAKRLMQQAGYSKSNPLKLVLKYNTSDEHKKIAIAIAAMWKQIGIEVEMFNQEVKVHYKHLKEGDFEVARAGWIGDYNDPTTFTDLMGDNTYNYSRHIIPQQVALAAKAAKTTDLNERAKILAQVEKIGLDAYSIIPIYYYVVKNIVSDKVVGWENNLMGPHRARWMDKK